MALNLQAFILNKRNVENEEKIVTDFVLSCDTKILGVIERDTNIQTYENRNQTVIEGDPETPHFQTFF